MQGRNFTRHGVTAVHKTNKIHSRTTVVLFASKGAHKLYAYFLQRSYIMDDGGGIFGSHLGDIVELHH